SPPSAASFAFSKHEKVGTAGGSRELRCARTTARPPPRPAMKERGRQRERPQRPRTRTWPATTGVAERSAKKREPRSDRDRPHASTAEAGRSTQSTGERCSTLRVVAQAPGGGSDQAAGAADLLERLVVLDLERRGALLQVLEAGAGLAVDL